MTLQLSWRKLVPILISLAIVGLAGVVLVRTLATLDPAAVLRQFEATPALALALALGLSVAAYGVMAGYEVAMVRYVGSTMPPWRPFLTSLVAYPLGHAIGFGALSGGAVRYRLYAAAGLPTLDIGKVVVLSTLPYAAGLGLLCGVSLLLWAVEAAPLLNLTPSAARGIGASLVVSHVIYVVLVLRWRRPLRLKGLTLELPTPRMTALQYLAGLADVLCAVGVLYVLLPDSVELDFAPFVAVYVVAILAGLLSSVPAGLGVFESMMLLMLRDQPPDAVLGAVLAYRLAYELVPFIWGLLLFLVLEFVGRRRPAA
jgi:phosphatidylglycerol lysyltransferase